MGYYVFQIGQYKIDGYTVLAPMAGITDKPFRQLSRSLGASLVVSEMISAEHRIWSTEKSALRLDHDGEPEPRVVQIVGSDPKLMAQAAQLNQDRGAQIIDINMGCPAKKVCRKAAGSALLKDEKLVKQILFAVVRAVQIPVTLKIRTGWCPQTKNAVQVARIAEACGVQMLSVHGRTRACLFSGNAEYQTIKQIKQQAKIPIIANGDIDSPQKAKAVLSETRADAVMIGRAAQGMPWIFKAVETYLRKGVDIGLPSKEEVCRILVEHMHQLYAFYGEKKGVLIARKHVNWYLKFFPEAKKIRQFFNQVTCCCQQLDTVRAFFYES